MRLIARGLPSSLSYSHLAGPHLALLLQLPLEVLQLLGVGELASGQLRDECLLLIQLPGQLTWRGNEGLWAMETSNEYLILGQVLGCLGAPTVLSLQLGSLGGEVVEGALGLFQLHTALIGLVLQGPGHLLQVSLQGSKGHRKGECRMDQSCQGEGAGLTRGRKRGTKWGEHRGGG